jgi:Tol biopolymer transport system component
MRDGDLELYKMHPDGTAITRLTHELGYDGGAYFSKDGKWICYRGHHPTDPKDVAEYKDLLSQSLVRPLEMDLWVMRADGSDKRQITHKAGASFAPYFLPDGKSLIFSSNYENPTSRNFDLYLVPVVGGEPEPVTRDPSFDGFPMFNANGKWLVFESNRNGKQPHETNIFLAEWK